MNHGDCMSGPDCALIRREVLELIAAVKSVDVGTLYRCVMSTVTDATTFTLAMVLSALVREKVVEVSTHYPRNAEVGPCIGVVSLREHVGQDRLAGA